MRERERERERDTEDLLREGCIQRKMLDGYKRFIHTQREIDTDYLQSDRVRERERDGYRRFIQRETGKWKEREREELKQ